jgi:hypothetical protein
MLLAYISVFLWKEQEVLLNSLLVLTVISRVVQLAHLVYRGYVALGMYRESTSTARAVLYDITHVLSL